MDGYVYLIVEWDKIEDNYNPVKIGFTKGKIENRIRELQTGNSSELHVLDYFKTSNPSKLEKMLHIYYFKYKTNGEWFAFPDNEIIDFKKVCEEKNSVIELLKRENYYCEVYTRLKAGASGFITQQPLTRKN